jgi:hypothetical protein
LDTNKTETITPATNTGLAKVAVSSSVLRLNFCAKLNICASISATSPSCKTLAASPANFAAANFFIKVKVLLAAACPFYLFRVRQVISKKSLKFFNENL